jgi:drug/metabolite transporter (DMT)-like permease
MGYLYALLASALWGLTYALDEKILEELPSLKVYFLHSLFGLCISGVLWVATGGKVSSLVSFPSMSDGGKLLLCALVVGAIAGMSIVSSIGSLGASRAAILEISYPIFVVVFSWMLFAKGVSGLVLVGGAFIFVGAALILIA